MTFHEDTLGIGAVDAEAEHAAKGSLKRLDKALLGDTELRNVHGIKEAEIGQIDPEVVNAKFMQANDVFD